MRSLAVFVVAVFLWGIFDVIRPVANHGPFIAALRTNAFDYYPLFIFAGMYIGKLVSFDEFVKYWKTFLVCYLVYVLLFYGMPFDIAVPWGGNWPLMMLPWNPPFAPLVLLAFWPLWRKWKWRWLILPASLVPISVSTGRGSFLGFAVGLVVLAIASRKHRQLIGGFIVGATLILTLVGPLIPGQKGRNANLDPYIQVCRVIATVNPDTAYTMLKKRGYDEAADDIVVARGTAEWREKIWSNCMASLNTTNLLLMGQGHGAPLVDYIPDGQDITTPHNFVIYATFYTGIIGAALYLLMLFSLLVASRKIKEPHLWGLYVSMILMTIMVAAVGNALETPMVAVPLYLVSGMCLGIKIPKRFPVAPAPWQQPTAWMPAPAIA